VFTISHSTYLHLSRPVSLTSCRNTIRFERVAKAVEEYSNPRSSSTCALPADGRDQPGELPNASRAARQPGDDDFFSFFSKPRKASRSLLDPQTAPALASQDVQGPRANSVLLLHRPPR
jgi:hypothetical protein